MPSPLLFGFGDFLGGSPERLCRGRRLGGPPPAQRKAKLLPPGGLLSFPDRSRLGDRAAGRYSYLFRGIITGFPRLPVLLLVETCCAGADEWALVGVVPRALRRVVRSANPEDHVEGIGTYIYNYMRAGGAVRKSRIKVGIEPQL